MSNFRSASFTHLSDMKRYGNWSSLCAYCRFRIPNSKFIWFQPYLYTNFCCEQKFGIEWCSKKFESHPFKYFVICKWFEFVKRIMWHASLYRMNLIYWLIPNKRIFVVWSWFIYAKWWIDAHSKMVLDIFDFITSHSLLLLLLLYLSSALTHFLQLNIEYGKLNILFFREVVVITLNFDLCSDQTISVLLEFCIYLLWLLFVIIISELDFLKLPIFLLLVYFECLNPILNRV